ncbi:MAG TPA: hypothetical protein VEC99_15370, partial [Clostridia bacterium]|nr:hypothetical protein [Clostridia bacterium]
MLRLVSSVLNQFDLLKGYAQGMKQFSMKWRIPLIVLVAGVLPLLVGVSADPLFGPKGWVNETVHTCVELAGSCIALVVAMLLLLRVRHEPSMGHLLWVVAGLVATGLLDFVHGVTAFGVAWSWLRHGATLLGGGLFGLVWLPLPKAAVQRKRVVILGVGLVVLAAALGICLRSDLLPAPWLQGDYSLAVKIANAVGGAGYLAAAVFFLRRYARQPSTEDLAFAGQTLLFGAAGVLFGFSHVWGVSWWIWHGFRFLAFSVLLAVAYKVVAGLYEQLALVA